MLHATKTTSKSQVFAIALTAGLLAGMASLPGTAAVPISDIPLSLPQNVPGNLALVPSVEFPTLISVANFGNYDVDRTYVGYFDSGKCYEYHFDALEANRHFYPVARTTDRRCTAGAGQWSGNYMNWAATQTIDPFRLALTGGYRVRDTTAQTWVEKAIADRNSTSNFPRRTVSGNDLISRSTPIVVGSWGSIRNRIDGLGNKMRFTTDGQSARLDANAPTASNKSLVLPYNPAIHTLNNDQFPQGDNLHGIANRDQVVYEVSVRVAVCVAGFLEAHCKQYGNNSKPEGLIQEYSDRIRYSIFGYLNNGGDPEPDGGVMRARQKFVGPNTHYPELGLLANTANEWDPQTGILRQNPDATDASNTGASIVDSGVINYLNKFGQMNTGRTAKSFDNVSELYYAATRYFRNLGNVPSYSALPEDPAQKRQLVDGFPVIQTWDDPIRYSCQANVILGIGDTNTWRDKNLPGTGMSTVGEQVTRAAEVANDTTVDVVADLHRVLAMEGDPNASTRARADSFSGSTAHNNSGYIAALAYAAKTRDIRPDLRGKQTISSYWVDVIEGQAFKTKLTNQYWLTGKYGGFTVPDGFNPDFDPTVPAQVPALPDTAWWSGESVVDGSTTHYRRPNNFFVAADANRMVASLRQAFARISTETQTGAGAALAATSTQVLEGGRLFQGTFRAGVWTGDLAAYEIDPATNAPKTTPQWRAGTLLDARDWATRKIYTSNAAGTARVDFTAANATALDPGVADYIRGSRANEAAVAGSLRPRQSVLGDIVHSQPVYVPKTDTYSTRRSMVYVGSNGGMLHGFDADSGAEVFGFVPKAAIGASMNAYAKFDPLGNRHRYFVDGELTVREVGNKTYLVGTTGRGAPGVFALDVTDPDNVQVVWDKTGGTPASNIPALGNSLGKPVIAEVAANQWAAVLGNGPNSATGAGALIIVNLAGSNVGTVKPVSVGGTNNGLSAPVVWRPNSNGYFNVAYAGDINGRMLKFTSIDKNQTAIEVLFNTAPNTGDVAQPITAAPQVARRPNSNETWVFFGTGQYLNSADRANKAVQTWYGIKEDQANTNRSHLVQRRIIAESQTAGGRPIRAIEAGTLADLNNKRGWYIDLVAPVDVRQGERIVTPLLFQGLALVANTRIPDSSDPCASADRSWTMAIDPFTGSRFGGGSYFDANDDGEYNQDDMVVLPDGTRVPNSGIGHDQGTAGLITIGSVLLGVDDSGAIRRLNTNRLIGVASRVSWREIVLNTRS